MRTLEQFNAAWESLNWFVKFHNKPVWLVALENDYLLSVVKPREQDIAPGTCANLYNQDLEIVDSVIRSEVPDNF